MFDMVGTSYEFCLVELRATVTEREASFDAYMKIAMSAKHAAVKPRRNRIDAPGRMNEVLKIHAIGISVRRPRQHVATVNAILLRLRTFELAGVDKRAYLGG